MTGPDRNDKQRDAPFPERVVAPFSRAAGALSSLGILIALGLTLYAVVMRYVFNRPPMWSDELLGYLLVALIMAGMTEAYRRNDHIAIDLVTSRLRGLVRLDSAAALALARRSEISRMSGTCCPVSRPD